MPLKALNCETDLPALPTYLSWRTDPNSSAQLALVDSVLQHLGVDADSSK